jgi:DNA-binding NarL/FixJ family response regulator
VLTTFEADEQVLAALRAGASGFLVKDTPPADIINAVRLVAAVGAGASNAEIATAVCMSEATVKAHVSRLLSKLDLNNRVQIAILVHDATRA